MLNMHNGHMPSKTKVCAKCEKEFRINPEDFEFYKKINVPTPTLCPDCRQIRRFMWRNERSWYKTKCSATGKSILSMFSPEKRLTIYELNYWKSDAWDPMTYGRDYNFSKEFFPQFKELFDIVPHPNLVQKNCVQSDYSNYTLNLKNCYFCVSNDGAEDSAYLFTLMLRNNQCVDGYMCSDCERSYEIVDCAKCSNVRFCEQSEGCVDSWLLYDCRNCTSCAGCVGLRGKQYCLFNEQLTKEEYQKRLSELKLGSYENFKIAKKKFDELKLKVPRKYAAILKSENAIGDDIKNSRNAHGFGIKDGSENIRYGYRVSNSKDIWDGFICWNSAEMQYETSSCDSQRTYFSALIWGGFDIQYSYNCYDCNNIFGCIGLRNKSYCILNRQYSKEEYEKVLPKITQQMRSAKEYGEFFPAELSPFSYNETIAQDYYPTAQKSAPKSHQTTISTGQIPDNITDASDSLLKEVIECAHKNCNEQCAGAFKMIPLELQYYRQFGVPLPRLCPNCRHFGRVKQKPPMKLYEGVCMKEGCGNTFTTPYSSQSPYIIYCETCYQSEIV